MKFLLAMTCYATDSTTCEYNLTTAAPSQSTCKLKGTLRLMHVGLFNTQRTIYP